MLKDNLPKFLYKIFDFKDLIDVEQLEIDAILKEICILIQNNFVMTSDEETIKRLEKIYSIRYDKVYSLGVRRENILAKLRSSVTINEEELKRIALAFGCGDISAKQVDNQYIITIKFISIYGIPEGLEVFKKIMRDVIPAHLDITYEFTYLTWAEFDSYNKTWQEWDNLNLTWKDFEKYKEAI